MASKGSSRFDTTHWSLIAKLPARGDDADDTRAREALEHLCNAYWRPLYTFARFHGHPPADAEDLTQGFLARIIETNGFGSVTPERGRFRSYLLGAFKHFMANAQDRERAAKRGGGRALVEADFAQLESQIADRRHPLQEPADADRAFDRRWAHETADAALSELQSEWNARGRADQFEAFRDTLTGGGVPRPELATRLGMTQNAVAVAIHRLRHRYATLIREAVARTVADEADIEDEMRYLIGILRER